MPPTGSILKEIMKYQQLRALFVPPAIAEQLLQEPNGIDFFKNIDFLCYTGAPFSQSAGKQLVEVTELVSLYGSTEAFQVPQLIPSKEDWSYMEWNPNFKLEMQPSDDEKGVYEMVLFVDTSTEHISALNHNVPGVSEWRTKDLFMPHPTKPTLWRYYGRRDDIIVLSNSEKFNPVPLELLVQSHPMLAGALVVGQGRVRASLLVEPKPTVQGDQREFLVAEIWPCVEEANSLLPGHGRILQSNIIIGNKPFTRAGKGTVVRKLTEQTFKLEIDALYEGTYPATHFNPPILKDMFERQAVLQFVRAVVTSSFPAAAEIADEEDLFSFGLDSLKSTELVKTLKSGIRGYGASFDLSWISIRTIYQYPTVQQLTTTIHEFVNLNKIPVSGTAQSRILKMEELLDKYTSNLPKRYGKFATTTTNGSTIALTGSTGSMGTFILANLLKNKNVQQIYCLNRSTDARQRQERLLASRGIFHADLSKLHFITIKLGHSKLGLSAEDYKHLVENVDLIVHNAWKLDFNLELQSFINPYLQSLRTIVNWSVASRRNPRIFFVSSISSVMGSGSPIPETIPQDFSTTMRLGYAESKCVAERIIADASNISGTPVTILRVGQVAGSTNPVDPVWPKQEWLYPVIQASKALGFIPATLRPINWIPIDQASLVVEELLSSPPRSNLEVYNIVNPHPVPWDLLVELLQERFGAETKVLPLEEWSRHVRKHNSLEIAGPTLEPALNMIDELIRGKAEILCSTEKSVAASKTMAALKPIDKNLLKIWLDQWNL
jgi:thioester reductase-like protein